MNREQRVGRVPTDLAWKMSGEKRSRIHREQIEERRAIEDKLEELKMADLVGELGVLSRRALDTRLQKIALRICQGGEGEGALVLVADMDNLKAINETASNVENGHSVGDAALFAAAGVLIESTRPWDTVARVGGDEFLVMCKVGSKELAEGIVEGQEGGEERGLIARVRGGMEEKRNMLKNMYGEDWPEDGDQKKPGQLSMGWSYITREGFGELYGQYVANHEMGVNKNGDFVSMIMKEADKNMFQDKKSKNEAMVRFNPDQG